MTRRRWRITVLAALATVAAAHPMTSLFTPATWFPQAIVVVALVAGLGLLLRGLTRSRAIVPVVQLLVVAYVIVTRFVGETLTLGIPTAQTLEQLGTLGTQALQTIQRYSAPAPLNEGVTLCLVAIVGLVAICVDAMAATWRSPAAAGLPLLTAYLVTATNGDSVLPLGSFIVPVALWLVMLHTTARAQFGRWSTTSATDADGRDDTSHDRTAMRAFTSGAMRLGLAGVVAALVIAALLPHFPPRYLTEGLGRTSGGSGNGTVGFNDTLDLTRSLNSSDATPVLTYQTTALSTSPLRVFATSYYSRGQWLQLGTDSGQDQPQPLPPVDQRRDWVLTVTDNELEAPHVAAPFPVVAVAMEGTPWTIDPVTRDIRVGRAVSTYRVTYADLAPAPPLLRESGTPNSPDVLDDDLKIPDTVRDLVQTWSDGVTAGKDNPLDRAIAIQDHLRDPKTYTYNLDLGPALRDENGRPLEPIRAFYTSKRGYCLQFATAMIMLARAQGIPARMAVGFLPGLRTGDKWRVRNADAHAWPELYFQGYGWLRFEPTPGTRSGQPPPYAVIGAGAGPTAGGRSVDDTESGTPTTVATGRPTDPSAGDTANNVSILDRVLGALTLRNISVVLGALVILLAAFAMPFTAWLARVRRRRRAVSRQDLIEAEWDDLTSHLRDLGLTAPDGGTLRVVREHYIADGHLEGEQAGAMRRVTATLEKSRYDRPERTSPAEADQLQRDIRTIRREVGRTRAWSTRLKSFFWPETGVRVWRRIAARFSRR